MARFRIVGLLSGKELEVMVFARLLNWEVRYSWELVAISNSISTIRHSIPCVCTFELLSLVQRSSVFVILSAKSLGSEWSSNRVDVSSGFSFGREERRLFVSPLVIDARSFSIVCFWSGCSGRLSCVIYFRLVGLL